MRNNRNKIAACAHDWAHALRPSGTASNLYFNGRTIFSYGDHFPIATIDGNYVYFTTRSYSATTAQHKSLARSAVSHKTFIYVSEVPVNIEPKKDKEFQKHNIDTWVKEIHNDLLSYNGNPRKKSLLSTVKTNLEQLNVFIEATAIRPDAKLASFLANPLVSTVTAYLLADDKKNKAIIKRRNAKARKAHQVAVTEWQNGLRNSIPYYTGDISEFSYLRYNDSAKRIETSKRVEVPLEIAKRFWMFLKSVLPVGCKDCNYTILDFKVDEITDKWIKIGCHTIAMEEAKRIAGLMKW